MGKEVMVAVAVGGAVGDARVAVAVEVGTLVAVIVDVDIFVAVGVTVAVFVMVGKIMDTGVSVAVAVARGVRVTTFGTHMPCPVPRLYWFGDMQLANWIWDTLTPYAWLRLYIVLPACTLYRTQPTGGPQGTAVLVGMDGTYMIEPVGRSLENRQLATNKFSGVLWWCNANVTRFSPG